ncbi:hypothetical protein [Corynebacterium aquilae]|uniref:Uncharacterized protein n=1 Tax=Corynebacterium aquilae DSM 44791 TaxID=1431546 RepID=A0A1L7CD61_9CORY|nr:hypothetical protein [Corynebacterium aquilae]APT83785.1 hypothetical protein CAQU_00300 [Corynebacterium aquilae DSM 44791]
MSDDRRCQVPTAVVTPAPVGPTAHDQPGSDEVPQDFFDLILDLPGEKTNLLSRALHYFDEA